MRYTLELAARAQAWLARDAYSTGPEGKRSPEGLLELATVWAAIQNVPLPSCIRQCQFSERARDVAAYVREYQQFSSSTSAAMSDTQPTSTYQLAPQFAGHSFVHEDYGKTVTADNLTDEDAAFFISKGRSEAFIARGGPAADEQPASGSDAPVPVKNEKPLVPEADLVAEQQAHATTKQALADEKEHGKAALKAEKEAHKATKKELSEVQKQLAEAQKQLTAVAEKAKPTAEAAPTDATADSQ